MTNQTTNPMSKALVVLGFLLAVGLVAGAYVLGMQTKNIGSGRASVSVKGLAEKPVKADLAEWRVAAVASGNTFAEALQQLRSEKNALDQFLMAQGFAKNVRVDQSESVEPRMVERQIGDRVVQVHEGYTATQAIVITTPALDVIAKAYKAVLDYKAAGHDLVFDSPNYLVSNLETIKMSLIGAATENAKLRASEFVKHSNAQLGAMRSASQGAFYILPNSADASTDEYGGTYDKTTVDKVARVVVTVEFNLKEPSF